MSARIMKKHRITTMRKKHHRRKMKTLGSWLLYWTIRQKVAWPAKNPPNDERSVKETITQ
jgi:hypothetical protein